MNTELPTPPPYHLALFPRQDDSEASQIASFELAALLLKIGQSDTNTFELLDFENDFKQFIKQPALPDSFKNEAYFIEAFIGKIFKPGVITLIVNFDMGDLSLMMTNFEIQKPDLQVLLIVKEADLVKWKFASLTTQQAGQMNALILTHWLF